MSVSVSSSFHAYLSSPSRVLQSQNESLLQAVKRLTLRVRELEAALRETQSQVSPQPHPLLQEGEQLADIVDASAYEDASESPKSEIDEAAEGVGSLIIGVQGQTRFHGQSSASEVSRNHAIDVLITDTTHISFCKHYCQYVCSPEPFNFHF